MADPMPAADVRQLKLTRSLEDAIMAAELTDGGARKVASYGAALGALRRRGLVTRQGALLTAKGAAARQALLKGAAHG